VRSRRGRAQTEAATSLSATRGPGDHCSALGVFLRRSLFELEPDEALVADDRRVVPGLDDVRVARTDLDLGSVFVLDRCAQIAAWLDGLG